MWAMRRTLVVIAALAAAGCSRTTDPAGGDPPGGSSAAESLTALPVDPQEIKYIVALGNLNPPGHTLPTDHMYLYMMNPDSCPCDLARQRTLYAPGGGVVAYVVRGADDGVTVRMNADVLYSLGHLLLDPAIQPGTPITAGQVLGTTSGLSFALDFGVYDRRVVNTGFVNPARYPATTLITDGPLKHYAEPYRTGLYALVRRDGAEKDGKIDYSQAGRLVGDWFLLGLPPADSYGPPGWPKSLAFVYDNRHPTEVRISIGGTLALQGVYAIGPADPVPATVAPAAGAVRYSLYSPFSMPPGGSTLGALLVQMTAPDTLRVEAFPGAGGSVAFTDSAKVYTR